MRAPMPRVWPQIVARRKTPAPTLPLVLGEGDQRGSLLKNMAGLDAGMGQSPEFYSPIDLSRHKYDPSHGAEAVFRR